MRVFYLTPGETLTLLDELGNTLFRFTNDTTLPLAFPLHTLPAEYFGTTTLLPRSHTLTES